MIKDQLDNNLAYAVWCLLACMVVAGCLLTVCGLVLWVAAGVYGIL